jgi:hypothetical protein
MDVHPQKVTPPKSSDPVATIRQHCERFDIRDPYRLHQLIDVLDKGAQSFVLDPNARLIVSFNHFFFLLIVEFRSDASSDPKLWADLRQLWVDLAGAQFPDSSSTDVDAHSLQSFCIALARFTRNIVAGVPTNQVHAL